MTGTPIDSQIPAESGGAGMLEKSFPGLSLLDNLSEVTMLRQIGLPVGLAASVAIGFVVVLQPQQPDYEPLYGSLNGVGANCVVEALTTADIPYKVEPSSGALLIKANNLGRARMKVVSTGVVSADNNVGFEILDKERTLGTNQFTEAINYHHGLGGKLARTVSSLDSVKAARAHLTIPKSSVLIRDNHESSALILVKLYPGRSLGPNQVMAIVNLVVTSMPELDKSQVTMAGQKGNLPSDQQELPELAMADKQFDFTRHMEGLLTQCVYNILQPMLGDGHYKAEVSAGIDFNAVESTSGMYNPDQPTLHSEQRNNEERQNSSGPWGVPGTLSNQPPGPASVPQQVTASAPTDYVAPSQPLEDANSQTIIDPKTGKPELAPYPTDKCDQTTRNYGLDRSINYIKQQQRRLRQLSMAVVLDDRTKVDVRASEVSHQPWSVDELVRFARLVQDSVGYDTSRGDSVSMTNTSFAPARAEEANGIPFYSQPWFWDIVKQVFGMLFILVLVFGVLRPVLSNITGGGKGKSLADGGGRDDDLALSGRGLEGSLTGNRVSIGGPSSILLPGPTGGHDTQLNAIKNLVAQDPGRIAQVVKEWINADEQVP